MQSELATGLCPHCGVEIYVWFVQINQYCPADRCHQPVEVTELKPVEVTQNDQH